MNQKLELEIDDAELYRRIRTLEGLRSSSDTFDLTPVDHDRLQALYDERDFRIRRDELVSYLK